MRASLVILALCFAAAAAGEESKIVPAEPEARRVRDAEKARRKRVAELVRQLGDASYRKRERASRLLAEIGDDALEALLAARESEDVEVAFRARELVGKIEKDTRRLEARKGWEPAGWDNPAKVAAGREKEGGRHLLTVSLSGEGEGAKSTVGVSVGGELREEAGGAARLVMRVSHDGAEPVPIAAAFLAEVEAAAVYFEAPAQKVPAGQWRELSFDLAARNYKCEATEWAYTSELKGREAITRVMVVIDAKRELDVRLTGIRFRK